MKALSIRQPYAWLILHAGKDVENREWGERYPAMSDARKIIASGDRFLIHAAKGMTRAEYDDACGFARQYVGIAAKIPSHSDLPRGGIVGSAQLTGIVERSTSPWFFGPVGLVLADPQPLTFIPYTGHLGFFDVPDALVRAERIG